MDKDLKNECRQNQDGGCFKAIESVPAANPRVTKSV